jgi:hypothetical protein
MVIGIGRTENVVWKPEVDYGVLVTDFEDAESMGYDVKVTPNFSHNFAEIDNNGGSDAEMVALKKNTTLYPFTIEYIPTNFKMLKYNTHSGVVSNDVISGGFDHTFLTALAIESFSMKWIRPQDTDQVLDFLGVTVKSYKLQFSKGTGGKDAFVKVVMECIAQDVVEGSALSATIKETGECYTFDTVRLTIDDIVYDEVNSGEINLDNGITDEDTLYASVDLNGKIGEPVCTKKSYDFTFNINQKDKTLYDGFTGEVLTGVSKLEIIRGATADSVEITFGSLYIGNALGATNMEGITNTDVVGRPMTLGIVVEDGLDDY